MATYQWKGAGYALPVNFGMISPPIKTRIDVPKLIADGVQSGLALVAAPNDGVALASTGFAANDILEVAWLPKGTTVRGCADWIITGEGATCTINVGVTSTTETHPLNGDIDGFGVFNIETADVADGTDDGDGYGSDNYPAGIIYVTNGSLDIEFNHATDTAEFEFWVDCSYVGSLVANT